MMHDRRYAEPLRWGPFALDLRARELRKDGRRIRLQDKPFELLAALVERPGEVLAREELRSRLWPSDTFVAFDDGLNTAVSKLREALGDSAEAPQFIETVPRRGYRFIAPLAQPPAPAVVQEPSESAASRRPPAIVLVLIAAIAIAASAVWFRRQSPTVVQDLVRLELQAPDGAMFAGSGAFGMMSPDGRQIAFRAVPARNRQGQICVQSLDGSARRFLPGTEGAEDFAWSEDSRSIAFRVPPGQLLRQDIARGVNVQIAGGVGYSVGMAWGEDAGILIGRGPGHGLSRVAADGAIADVTALDAAREETMHAWPQVLADGRSYVYLAISRRPENSGIYLARLGESSRVLLAATGFKGIVSEPDLIVYLRGRRLVAQRFDVKRAALLGEPIQVAEGLTGSAATGGVAFSLSRTGTLVYAAPRRPVSREAIWVTRAGQWVAALGPPDHDMSFSLSPDDRWVVFERQSADVTNPELWLHDVQQSVTRQVTSHPGNDEGGAWAPDSRQFVYARHRGLHLPSDLYVKDVSRPDVERPLLVDDTGSKHPFDWSADGRFILYSVSRPDVPEDIWVLPVAAGGPPYPWLATRFRERGARFSPNGRWVAYESDESGRNEIYVRAFDDPRARWQVSTAGGMSPQWRRDGRELYYISADHRLMAVEIEGKEGFETGASQPLFELRRLAPNPRWRTPYAVSADAQRFLVGAVTDEGGDEPLSVLLNWRSLVAQNGQ